jgi:Type II secretion system (T2SS), protein M
VTSRDRLIIMVVLVAAVLAGVWFVGVAPKRKEAADLSSQVDTAKQQLAEATQSVAQARSAKARYDSDYANLARLGKAVPKSDALPSLVYQLQSAAHDARIDFKALKLAGSGTQAAPSAPAAASSAVAKSDASASSSTGGSGSSTPSTSGATPAPATQAASASLPPGAAVGSAGFPTMPFSFVFNGSFFDMERFLHEVQRFVRVDGKRVDVRGRLLSIDGFALSAGPNGFPSVRASISATAYILSPDDTATSGGSGSTSSASSNSTAPTAQTAGVTG